MRSVSTATGGVGVRSGCVVVVVAAVVGAGSVRAIGTAVATGRASVLAVVELGGSAPAAMGSDADVAADATVVETSVPVLDAAAFATSVTG